jgi:D-3-phosphoglycerate dehydrogenase
LKKPLLLIVEPNNFSENARTVLEKTFEIRQGPCTRAELLASISKYDALMTRLGHRFDEEMISRGKSIKAIGTPTTGLNHIDIPTATQRGIRIFSLLGERKFLDNIHATAEFTWGILLALLRKIPAATESVKQKIWDRDFFRGCELNGKVLGVIGYGRLGTKVANYGRAFGMQVIACDPNVTVPNWVKNTNLYELAASADIVVVHASYDISTHGMLTNKFFDTLRPGAFLVNTARGELIDEFALLDSLKRGRLAGAALDVLCFENSAITSPESLALIEYSHKHDNLLITPHIAGATDESMEKTEVFIAGRLCDYFQGYQRGGQLY